MGSLTPLSFPLAEYLISQEASLPPVVGSTHVSPEPTQPGLFLGRAISPLCLTLTLPFIKQ